MPIPISEITPGYYWARHEDWRDQTTQVIVHVILPINSNVLHVGGWDGCEHFEAISDEWTFLRRVKDYDEEAQEEMRKDGWQTFVVKIPPDNSRPYKTDKF